MRACVRAHARLRGCALYALRGTLYGVCCVRSSSSEAIPVPDAADAALACAGLSWSRFFCAHIPNVDGACALTFVVPPSGRPPGFGFGATVVHCSSSTLLSVDMCCCGCRPLSNPVTLLLVASSGFGSFQRWVGQLPEVPAFAHEPIGAFTCCAVLLVTVPAKQPPADPRPCSTSDESMRK